MFTCVLQRYVAFTVSLVPKLSEGADSVGGQLRGNKDRVPIQWHDQFWQSSGRDGAGKQGLEFGFLAESQRYIRVPKHNANVYHSY